MLILSSVAKKSPIFRIGDTKAYFIVDHAINGDISLEVSAPSQTEHSWVPTGIEWQNQCARIIEVCPHVHYRLVADRYGSRVWVFSAEQFAEIYLIGQDNNADSGNY